MKTVIWGLLLPFIGTSAGAACVFFLKKDLEAGQQILRITITGNNCNIDKLELKCISSGIHDMLYDVPVTNQNSYDLFGRKVDNNYKGIIIRNGKKYINK